MMEIIVALLLAFFQFLTGFGLLGFFPIRIKPALYISLALLLGIAVFSFVPFLMELVKLPLTAWNTWLTLAVICILLNIRFKHSWRVFHQSLRSVKFRVRLYEWPVMLCLLIMILVSVWRCYYWPPTPRDLTSGAEVIAEYAVREKTMINSVFSVNLETTNNQFKPPFITSLQIIYKYAGFPFGQVWLSSVFIALLVFLYHALIRFLHRVLAGILLIAFVAIPEMYAYTFMALFDYSNAVFFFLSFYFLIEYFKRRQTSYFALAGLLMGIATYIRSETLILAGLAFPLILLHHLKHKDSFGKLVRLGVWFFAPALILYVLPITIYFNLYLPVKYDVQGLVNNDLTDLSPIWQRLKAMNSRLIFNQEETALYGYFVYLFLIVLIADLLFNYKLNRNSRNWLFAVFVVYFGMPVLGYLLPLLDIEHSTKRGLFKIFPLMLLYMGTSNVLRDISGRLKHKFTFHGRS